MRLWVKRPNIPPDSGGGPMARYHLYFLRDNKLVGDDSIEAADDNHAIRIAKEQGKGQAVEVWNAHSRIRVVAPAKSGQDILARAQGSRALTPPAALT